MAPVGQLYPIIIYLVNYIYTVLSSAFFLTRQCVVLFRLEVCPLCVGARVYVLRMVGAEHIDIIINQTTERMLQNKQEHHGCADAMVGYYYNK